MEVNATPPPTGSALSSQTSAPTMGEDEFLQLLVAQLKHQDPLSPMDNTEFVAQLAQFSSLEQVTLVNENLQAQAELIQGSTNAMAASFIGREVLAVGNGIAHTDGESSELLSFELEQDADATITISNSSGAVVRTLDAGALTAGRNSTEWDGLDEQGNAVADGNYTFNVSALDEDGSVVRTQTYTSGIVTGVRYGGGGSVLLLQDSVVLLADVLEISDPTVAAPDPFDSTQDSAEEI
jgi:flagellar basal-body rod modification protein FlgD